MNETSTMAGESEQPGAVGPGPLAAGLFLASAVVIFGAIMTGYALLRFIEPDAFTWAPKLLDRRVGILAAASSVVALVAAAGAFRFAWRSQVRPARALLSVAVVAGVAALSVRGFELPSATHRAGLAPVRTEGAATSNAGATQAATTHVGDPSQGKRIFLGTCAACHAPDGAGVKGQGQNLRDSLFLKDKNDQGALAFVKKGRQPFDPESKLHLAMPARGGNPVLTDANLLDAIAYVRELQKQAAVAAAAPAKALSAAVPAPKAASSDQPQVIDGELWLPHSILPAGQVGPAGSVREVIALQQPGAEGRREANVRRFFAILLFVNGLHAVYLLFGVVLGAWLVFSTVGDSVSTTSLAATAAYWVVISVIGLLIVPAFYV